MMIYGSSAEPLPAHGLVTFRLLNSLLMVVGVANVLPMRSFMVPLMLFTVSTVSRSASMCPLKVRTLVPEPAR